MAEIMGKVDGGAQIIAQIIGSGPQGKQGVPGEKGDPGKDGRDGKDGLSPTVTVSDIQGGHRITITDANGDKTVDVMDGEHGAAGKTPEYGVDYGTPEQIARIAQDAANILQPDVNHLKNDLASKEPLHKVLSATLETGETMLTITDDAITDNAMIYIYTNVWGVQPSAVEQSGNTLSLTFDAQSADLGVKVEVR